MELNFNLNNEYSNLLYDLKEIDGKNDLTANQYAKEILEFYLWKRKNEINK